MGTLYECLREARLEQFYPAFRANGITRSEALIDLGMPEFCALGITDSEDRRRLTELVNIIKEVHSSGFSASPTPQRRGGSSRQHQQSTAAHDERRVPTAHSGLQARLSSQSHQHHAQVDTPQAAGSSRETRVPNFSAASYLDMLELLSDSSQSDGVAADGSDEEETLQQQTQPPLRSVLSSATVRSSVSRSVAGMAGVERVKSKPYNYGVHKINTPTKSRPPRSSVNRTLRDEKIKVCVRKRPLTRRETRAKDEDIVNVESTTTLIVNEPKLAVDLKAYTLQHEFIFDEVFHESCSNEDVYTRAARPLISCIFNGGSATCFAYGQTGAGKTHTMLGDAETPGLYLLAGRDIFNIINSGQYGRGLHVWISFFEIYCGQLFDLLNRRNRLHAREDGSRQVCIAGLTETEATSVNSLVQTLEYGNSVRSKGATGVNPDSSRSHAILQLDIRNSEDVKVGKISFIDLAGSERASDVTDTDKQTRIEGAEINQSLLALKECIRSIDQDSKHTPFRQSKLTHILKDSFVGNSRTCMIANISPAQSACENTLNTLRYADRVKELKRDSVRTSAVGQAMNLLMNIPPSAPSIFHPSNILSTSTPMRHGAQSRLHQPAPANVILDLSETPIRGHNLPRRPHRDRDRHSQPAPAEPNQAADAVSPPPPTHTTSGPSTRSNAHTASAASTGAAMPPPDASPSESDHTDTDSCNVTHQNFKLGATGGFPDRRLGVAGSMDTEYDFPTSDFNNPDDFNDLNHPKPREDARPVRREAWREQGQEAASGAETVDAGVNQPTAIHRPILKPVVYRSIDVDTEEKAQHRKPETAKKVPPAKEFFSSDESLDDEELLADGPSGGSAQTGLNNLATPPSQQSLSALPSQSQSCRSDQKKHVMVPHPAVSSDLTKFTQRPSLRLTQHEQNYPADVTGMTQGPTPQHKHQVETNNKPSVETSVPRDLSSTTRAKIAAVAPRSPGRREAPEVLDHSSSPEEQRSGRPLPHSRHSPVSLEHAPHPPPSPPPGRHNSPSAGENRSKASSKTQQHDATAGIVDDSPTSIRRYSDISEPKGGHYHRRAFSSPTGEKSDDSSESIRASLSDQGQGGYRRQREIDKINMRKERSDPMLALDLQRKKQTLPDPQNFSKMLTRSNLPKSGMSHHRDTSSGGSWKVVHDQLPSPKSDHQRQHSSHFDFGERNSEKPSSTHPGESHSEPSSLAHVRSGSAEGDGKSNSIHNNSGQQNDHTDHQHYCGEGAIAKTITRNRDVRERTPPSGSGGLLHQDRTNRSRHHSGGSELSSSRHSEHAIQLQAYSRQSLRMGSDSGGGHASSGQHQQQHTDNINNPGYFKVATSTAFDMPGKNAAVITEKLAPGAVFSPIHPYPTTVTTTPKSVGEPATPPSSNLVIQPTLTSDAGRGTGEPNFSAGSSNMMARPNIVSTLLLQAAPVPVNSSHASSAQSIIGESVEGVHKARSDLISAHEDQLANITSLCKHEMRLLLNAKKVPGKRGFDDYLRRVSDILQQKMAAMASLQGQITLYHNNYPPTSSVSGSVISSVSASVSDVGGSTMTQPTGHGKYH